MGKSIDHAVVIVGGLLLEQAPKAILLSDEMLGQYYEPALQNFQDFCALDGVKFIPGDFFRQQVMDHIRYYLDMKRMRFEQ